ncbi:hypothetical protein NQ176_g3986 [Zarea fungicola]|uniref:Uncharacterized protein n=1 Tax=Zarea fungicola TaxID=93591 RepID=A0ACC1NH09_9HYPO|nr:hypothetical protein NQ176_g3986 [Lecanicillium fungicola]
MVALTALVTSRAYVDQVDYVNVPGKKITYVYGNCHAELFGKPHGFSVAAKDLLSSFGQLAARCQNGWFYYDSGWVGGAIGGRAGWKRDTEEDSMSYLLKDAIFTWEEADSPEQLPLPEDSVSDKDLNDTKGTVDSTVKRQHSSHLIPRASPVGVLVSKRGVKNLMFYLYRGTGYHDKNQQPKCYEFPFAVYAAVGAVINSAKSNFGTGVLRNGIAQQQPSLAGVTAIALAAQLNTGVFSNWDKLATFLDGEFLTSVVGVLMSQAVYNMAVEGWTGAVYHIYNPYNEVVVTFILNGVTGLVSALPTG